jgi:hypothetical protein
VDRKGGDISEWPVALQVRRFPGFFCAADEHAAEAGPL